VIHKIIKVLELPPNDVLIYLFFIIKSIIK
jgi:hypothetical protein